MENNVDINNQVIHTHDKELNNLLLLQIRYRNCAPYSWKLRDYGETVLKIFIKT